MTAWLKAKARAIALWLARYKLGRRIMGFIVTLWATVRGHDGIVEMLTALLGLTFAQFGFTDQQLGDSIKAARIEHLWFLHPTGFDADGNPLPEKPTYTTSNWQDFTTGLEKLASEISGLFALPDDMVWTALDASGDRFLARVAA